KRAEVAHALSEAREQLEAHPKVAELRARVAAGQARAEDAWHELQAHLPQLPQLPSVAELRERLLQAYADSPSTEDIVARARQLLAETFSAQVFPDLAPQRA